MPKPKLFLRYFIAIVCTIGCVYHLYYISAVYFKYPVSIIINVQYPQVIEWPSTSTCFYLQTFGEEYAPTRNSTYTLTISDIHNRTASASKQFVSYTISDHSTHLYTADTIQNISDD